jgi:hypothetical protein
MRYNSLADFLARGNPLLVRGPVALIFAEDDVEVASTLRHHLDLGFLHVVAFMPDSFDLPTDLEAEVHGVTYACGLPSDVFTAINKVIKAATPNCWLYYCYNAEYLFFPFSETRGVRELLNFHAEERRSAMLTYVFDLYAADLQTDPNAVTLKHAMLDRSGYFAQARADPATHKPLERQLDFFGGLRWRLEEHVPRASRRIDRISLFRAKSSLVLGPTHQFNDPEYNTYACPWHHNLTAAVCSFRAAKALRRNPGSREAINTLACQNSVRFEWTSRQLLDLGLIEPGQWF